MTTITKAFQWREIGSLLGFFLFLLAIIVCFVTVVEYDPTGKLYKRYGTQVHIEVQQDSQLSIGRDAFNNTYSIKRSEIFDGYQEAPKSIYGYSLGTSFIPEIAIPHAPRDVSDFIIPLIFLLISLSLLRCAPQVLYLDIIPLHD